MIDPAAQGEEQQLPGFQKWLHISYKCNNLNPDRIIGNDRSKKGLRSISWPVFFTHACLHARRSGRKLASAGLERYQGACDREHRSRGQETGFCERHAYSLHGHRKVTDYHLFFCRRGNFNGPIRYRFFERSLFEYTFTITNRPSADLVGGCTIVVPLICTQSLRTSETRN
jgi:hypothetical protein